MTPRKFYDSKPRDVVEEVAKAAGTSMANFKQIALANGSVSAKLAAKLSKASSGEMSELEILYPERFGKKSNSAA